MKTIRIFISSPGDVAEERERARQVIDSLKRRYAGVFQLKPVLWEDLPLQADLSFQHGIDVVLSSTGIDLAIFILWSRLGSPQGGAARRPDGTPYRSGTERELDLMLEARRQSGGTRPDMLVYTRQDDASFTERLRGKSTRQQEIEITQKKLVESFITEEFQDATQGINLRAFHSFDRPQAFSQRLRTHLIEMLDAMAGGDVGEAVWDIEIQGPPFMGLEAFGEKQALVFCGRDSEILEARRALAAQAREGCAFLLLTGASGSGKSSLARAGLLPAIAEHELDETVAEWRTLSITPSELGADPIAGLITLQATPGLLPELRAEGSSLADVSELLAENPASAVNLLLKRALAEASEKRKGGVRILLLIDQLEELFTMENREPFLAALEALARSGVCWVVATVRGDFLGEVQKSATLVRLMSGQGLIPLLAPDADALRHMIEEPARLAGLHFEEKNGRRLSDQILADAARHADLLPLVEHVLRQLFDQRTANGALTWQAYETLGGVEGALSQHADAVLVKLPPSVQATLPNVLKRLVTLSETTGGAEDGGERLIRQRVDLATFPPDSPVRQLVDAFISERLLTASGGEGDGATVTLAHEALLRVWPTAAAWAEQNRDILRTRARVALRMQEGSPLLKGDPLLESARAFCITHPDHFDAEQRGWIQDAIAAAEASVRRASRRRRFVFIVLSCLSLVACAGGAWALRRERDARLAEKAAEASTFQARRAKATAEGLINSMLFDLREKLVPLGQVELLDDVSHQAESYFFENPPDNPEAERNQAAMWNNRGDVLIASGNLTAARQAYQSALEISERLAKADPGNADAQLNLCSSLLKLGLAFIQAGDLEAARLAFQQSLEIGERLAISDPRNPVFQRALSHSLHNLGLVAERSGCLSTARQAYSQAIPIQTALAQADPLNSQVQSEWRLSLHQLGDLAGAEGDVDAARLAHQQATEIAERLANADLLNAVRQSEWSDSLERLGNFFKSQSDPTMARTFFQQSLEIRERLAKADPSNVTYQQAWSVSLNKLGDLAHAEGDLATARQAYQQAVEITERLAKADPLNTQAEQNMRASQGRLGLLSMTGGGIEAARQSLQKIVNIAERNAKENPHNVGTQRDWSVALRNLGNLAKADGDLAAARKAYVQAIEISEAVIQSDRHNIYVHKDLLETLHDLGDILIEEGDLEGARQTFLDAIELVEPLAKANQMNAGLQRDLVVAYLKPAFLLEQQNSAETSDWWHKAHQQLTAMIERGINSPDDQELLELISKKAK